MFETWTLHTELEDSGLPDDVGLHEQYTGRAGADGQWRRPEGTQLQGQVRVPAGVDDERVLQSAQAVQYDEDWRQPRLQGLRHRHAHRLPAQVKSLFDWILLPDFQKQLCEKIIKILLHYQRVTNSSAAL